MEKPGSSTFRHHLSSDSQNALQCGPSSLVANDTDAHSYTLYEVAHKSPRIIDQ